MKKIYKNLNNTLFDVAVEPMIIALFGVPILLIIIIGGVIALSIKYVNRAKKDCEIKADDDISAENDDKKE